MTKTKFQARYKDVDTLKEFVQTHFEGNNAKFLDAAMQAIAAESMADDVEKLNWSEEELELINQATKIPGVSFNDLLRQSVLAQARSMVDTHDRVTAQLETDGTLQKSTAKGFAEYRITQCVEALIKYNVGCTDVLDRWLINPSLIYALTNSNTASIKNWFEINAVKIEDHHKSVGLSGATRSFNSKKSLTIDGVKQTGSEKMVSRNSDYYETWVDNLRKTLGVIALN